MIIAAAITNALGNTGIDSVSQMTAEQGLLALKALNLAVQKWYRAAPRTYREKAITHTVSAPRAIESLTVTEGSTTVGDDSFTSGEFCQAVVIAGEPLFANRVAGTNSVRTAIRQATGTTSATVYDDVLLFQDWSVERVVGEPQVLDQRDFLSRVSGRDSLIKSAANIESYDLEPLGHSRVESVDAHMALRFWPMPSATRTIELTVSILPRRYGLLDLQDDTVSLPVQDELFDSTLLPLLEWEIARTRLYTGEPKEKALLLDEAREALARVKTLPGAWAKQNIRIRTQIGY